MSGLENMNSGASVSVKLLSRGQELIEKIAADQMRGVISQDIQELDVFIKDIINLNDKNLLDRFKQMMTRISSSFGTYATYHAMRTNPTMSFGEHGNVQGLDATLEKGILEPIGLQMKRAYWDAILYKATNGDIQPALDRITELAEAIASYMSKPRQEAFLKDINVPNVHAHLNNGTFDSSSVKNLVLKFVEGLGLIESAYQAALTENWFKEFCRSIEGENLTENDYRKMLVDALKFLLSKIDALAAEIKTLQLKLYANEKSSKKELDSFKKLLSEGHISLDIAKSIFQPPSPGAELLPLGPELPPFDRANRAFVKFVAKILCFDMELTAASVPEPLQIDLHSLIGLQNSLQRVVVLCLVAVIVAPLLGAKQLDKEAKRLTDQMFSQINDCMLKATVKLADIVDSVVNGIHSLREKEGNQELLTGEEFSTLSSQLSLIIDSDAPICKLFTERTAKAFQTAMLSKPINDKIVNPNQSVPSRLATGISNFGMNHPESSYKFAVQVPVDALGVSPHLLSYAAEELTVTVAMSRTLCQEHLNVYGPLYLSLLAP
eukprot:Platyproteum_vivax@DN1345_c0_g1_i1.p1